MSRLVETMVKQHTQFVEIAIANPYAIVCNNGGQCVFVVSVVQIVVKQHVNYGWTGDTTNMWMCLK